jgi:OOP family OmpA-OmpF porin
MKTIRAALILAAASALSACCLSLPDWPNGPVAAQPAPAPVVAAAPAPAPVPAAAPVAADSDADGVPDEKDRCPASPRGSAVNDFGCPKGEKIVIDLRVEFDTNKSVVKPAYDARLKEAADFLKAYPGAKAEIEGHTDNVGDAAANKALSQRRADAVRQALIDRFGVDGARLTAVGYGLEKPIADNGTAAGRAQNRRVVATFSAVKE